MVMSLTAAASWLRAGPVIVSYADIFYRGDVVRALAQEPGALVISFDRLWRKLWSRRFADPLSDAETFKNQSAPASCSRSGVARKRSRTSRVSTWVS